MDREREWLARRAPARVRTLVCGIVCVGLLTVASSAAASVEFGHQGSGAGEFEGPTGVAINDESGEVYVVDRNNQRVQRFTEEGGFQVGWGWGVADGTTEALQTCLTKCFAGLEGAGAGEFSFPEGGAVDNDPLSSSHGDVYVFDARNHRVEKFDASGTFVLMFGGEVNAAGGDVCLAGEECQAGVSGSEHGQFESAEGDTIDVDAAGKVYVGDRNRVQVFTASGAFEHEIPLPGVGSVEALAVDTSEEVYVLGNEVPGVRLYDSTGSQVGPVRDELGGPGSIAVGPTGELFVADNAGGVHHTLEYDASGTQTASFDASTDTSNRLGGIAFNPLNDAIYTLTDRSVRITPLPPPGPLVVEGSEHAGELTPTSATLSATVNPEGPEATSYHFEYGPTAAYGSSTAVTPLESGEHSFEDQLASAEISGLSTRTEYHFRVVATNALGETTDGPDATFTTLPPALVNSESVSQVSSVSALLGAEIDPLGRTTDYHFEYGLTDSYEASAPIPDAQIAAGSGGVPVSILIQGLHPGSTYHFRVVAHNALGTVDGEDRTFVTQGGAAAGLLDARAWEMVSPPSKQGTALEAITNEGGVIQAAEGGGAITYVATAPIVSEPSGNRSVAYSQVLSNRSGAGWSTTDISVAHEKVAGLHPGFLSEYRLFSSDLSTGLVEPEGASPLSPQATERTSYLREADGTYVPVVNPSNVPPGTKFGGTERLAGEFVGGVTFATATPDLSHLVLVSPQALTTGFTPINEENTSVYEWSGGALRLISVLPDGTPSAEEGESAIVGGLGQDLRGAVSSDGSRVVFEAEDSQQNSHLYLRDVGREETVQVDAPASGVTVGQGRPRFQLATGDGAHVFFLDTRRLTPDATARPAQPDLYECSIGISGNHLACTLRDLTVDENAGEAANVQGTVLGSDSKGEHVFFVAKGALAPGATPGSCERRSGGVLPAASSSCNLYMADTATGDVRLVATLSARDFPDWEAGNGFDLAILTARVTSDARYLAFMSQRSLTGYDNRDQASGVLDEEVYLYDSSLNKLTCVSCNPSGARPVGVFDPPTFPGLLVERPLSFGNQWLAASVPGWTPVDLEHSLYQSRYLSDSGRLFFNSADSLVPQDGNGKEDVYEYEPAGVGSCTRVGGCVGLVSSGSSNEESAFMDASSSGDDVFFLSASKLSPSDVDEAYDLYDAHVCSAGSPCPPPAASVSPPCTTGDSCRAAPPPQPQIFGPPPSATFSGSGNVTPTPVLKPKPKPLTRAQKLAKALKACKKKPKSKRASCNRRARKLYGPKHNVKKSSTKRGTAQKGRGK